MESKIEKTNSGSLLYFVLKNDVSSVEEILKQQFEVNSKALGQILWLAVWHSYLEIASLFVKTGADLNLKNPLDESGSILHELLKSMDPKHHQLAILMIDHGADINARNKENETVLHWAIKQKIPIGVIEYLMKRGARVKMSVNEVVFSHPNAFKILQLFLVRNHSNDAETKAKQAAAVLFHCSTSGGDETQLMLSAKLILNMKLPIDKIDRNGSTLHAAIKMNRFQMVKLLIEYGFDVNRPAENGVLPLYAASELKESAITELLIRTGARVNFRSGKPEYFKTDYAIHAACKCLSNRNIRVLLRHGADVNLRNGQHRTPFSIIGSGLDFGFLNHRYLTHSYRIFIRHFAVLFTKGERINEHDLKSVNEVTEWRKYYSKCLNELKKMKETEIINNVSCFHLFEKDIRMLLFVTRRYNFDVNEWKDKFPIYYRDLNLENVGRRKKLLSEKEEALYESLEDIMPQLPLETITYYLYLTDIE